jgi:hypothetical protein
MAVKSSSKSSRPTAFLRLAYSAPASGECTIEETRRFMLSATKALPFVKLRADDHPMWRPENYWHVQPTGNKDRDRRFGCEYARKAIAAMKADHNGHLIALVVQDIINDAVERLGKTGCAKLSPIELGFLSEISATLAGAP